MQQVLSSGLLLECLIGWGLLLLRPILYGGRASSPVPDLRTGSGAAAAAVVHCATV
jgi:hypothetical protein